ncbi:hypothetical protein EDD16DRAFT_1518198 [Pisolithus croceorrhizus]|nr:hypothetical protein EV401DRAFT_2196821 [Pisolithus croceorrhizus]KAI6122883.1 hypothetical protein EDD16DRAFT_1518198 [Pisolithus croceorrhizus]
MEVGDGATSSHNKLHQQENRTCYFDFCTIKLKVHRMLSIFVIHAVPTPDDGQITLLTGKCHVTVDPQAPHFSDRYDGQWNADTINAHAIGCNAVSLVSAGCDNLVQIWCFHEETQSWVEEEKLEGHTDWVQDVAWAPNIGLPRSYIATASQDKTVLIWTKDSPTSPWVKTPLDPSTSTAPNSTVSCGDGKVTLWRENLKGIWECVLRCAAGYKLRMTSHPEEIGDTNVRHMKSQIDDRVPNSTHAMHTCVDHVKALSDLILASNRWRICV